MVSGVVIYPLSLVSTEHRRFSKQNGDYSSITHKNSVVPGIYWFLQ